MSIPSEVVRVATQLAAQDVRFKGLPKLDPWSKTLTPRQKKMVLLACKESREYFVTIGRYKY